MAKRSPKRVAKKPEISSDILSPGLANTRLIAQAISSRWPIPEAIREALIKRQAKIALDPNTGPREATRAFEAIMRADEINLEAEKPKHRSSKAPDDSPQVVPVVLTEVDVESLRRSLIDRLRESGIARGSAVAGSIIEAVGERVSDQAE